MYANTSLNILSNNPLRTGTASKTRFRMGRLQCLLPSDTMLEVSADGCIMSVYLADRNSTVIFADETRTLENPRDSLAFARDFVRKHQPRK